VRRLYLPSSILPFWCSWIDEQVFDNSELYWRGHELYPMDPISHNDNKAAERQNEPEDDHELMQQDIIAGFLETELLVRLRYSCPYH